MSKASQEARRQRKAATRALPCPICLQAREMNKEDVYPVWLRTFMGKLDGAEPPPPRYLSICTKCNDRSGRVLENPAAPLFKKLADGFPAMLTPDEQRLLSAWCIKTMFMDSVRTAQLSHDRSIRNLDLRNSARGPLDQMLDTGSPPEFSLVYLGKRIDVRNPDLPDDMSFLPPVERPFIKLFSSLTVGSLYARCFYTREPVARDFLNALAPSPYYVTIWPPAPVAVQWPPPLALATKWINMAELIWARGNESIGMYPRGDARDWMKPINDRIGWTGKFGWDAKEGRTPDAD